MPELRTDRLTGRSVIVAENRAGRPNEFAPAAGQYAASVAAAGAVAPESFTCPFCPGQEALTPPAVFESKDEVGHWRIRVVPNKFPALTLDPMLPLSEGEGTRDRPALGAHEVVVESARHVESVTALSVSELDEVLSVYASRLRHWRNDGRFRYGLVFKNLGSLAGASLSHVHSQLVALPDVPPLVQRELDRAEAAFKSQGECPYCRLVNDERKDGARIVLDRDGYVAFCPYASLQPYEVWLLPARHEPWFEQGDHGAAGRLADVLHGLLKRVEAAVPGAAYNLLLRTAPWDEAAAEWCHWRIEILPRVAGIAGMELATGVHINPRAPERAARHMRQN